MMKWCFAPVGGEEKCRDTLISNIEFSDSELILDMCCGTGGSARSLLKMAKADSHITGIDLSLGQLHQALRRQDLRQIQFVEGDVTDACFRDGIFDKVFITFALHEMIRDSRLKALREARRIIKKNGSLVILEMDNPSRFLSRLFCGFWLFYWWPFNPETPTKKEMLRYGIDNEMKESGFRHVFKTKKFNGVLQTVQGIK